MAGLGCDLPHACTGSHFKYFLELRIARPSKNLLQCMPGVERRPDSSSDQNLRKERPEGANAVRNQETFSVFQRPRMPAREALFHTVVFFFLHSCTHMWAQHVKFKFFMACTAGTAHLGTSCPA